jgi:hypothetical protein
MAKMAETTILLSKLKFLYAISRFAVQNDGMCISQITREKCIFERFGLIRSYCAYD